MSATNEPLPDPQLDADDRRPISAPQTNGTPRRGSESTNGRTDLTELILDKLANATHQGDTPSLAFIPYANLKDIWTDARLVKFLDHQQIELDEDQIKTAKEDLLRTISILLDVGWRDWWRFKDIFFPADSYLARRRRDTNVLSFERSELEEPSFLGGDSRLVQKFLRERWIYFPLEVKQGSRTVVDKESRLPFIHEPVLCGRGSYGEVTKEVIARGQYMIPAGDSFVHLPKEITVARKRFPTSQHVFEVKHLKLLRDAQGTHKRIVYDLGTLSVRDEVYILLPWANMDLEKFMKQDNGHVSLETRLQGLIGEAAELAGALEFLHNGLQTENGREAICHMDLKPENILVFKDGNTSWTGVWKITDFGISQTARIRSDFRSGQGHGNFSSFSPRIPARRRAYSAPEPVTLPANDIWSFGCILVRVVAFGLGLQERRTLDRQREMPDLNEPDDGNDHFCRGLPPRLNSHVEGWIRSLPNRFPSRYNERSREELRDLLLSMLAIEPSKRPSAGEVRSKLLHLKIHFDEIANAAVSVPTGSDSSSVTTVSESSSERQHSSQQSVSFDSQSVPERPPTPNEQARIAPIPETLQQFYSEFRTSHLQERPLIYAIRKGNTSAVRALLEHEPGPDVEADSSGVTPLVLAVRTGDEDMLKTLLAAPWAKDGIDKLSPPGRTPLMEAARDGCVGMVSELLKCGARWDIVSTRDPGWTCLHYAVFNDTCDGELILAFKGFADFTKTPPSGKTPLMLFCSTFARYAKNDGRWRSKLNALLECESELDQKCNGESPIEVAVRDKQMLLAKALHEKGAVLRKDFSTRNLYLTSKMERVVLRVKSPVGDDLQKKKTKRASFLQSVKRS